MTTAQLQSYAKQDPPPTRVIPIPLQILLHLLEYCYRTPDAAYNAMGHMLTLGFFFLLCPGEYAYTDNPEAAPFQVCDVHLLCNNIRINPYSCSEWELESATHIALEFTKQKNGVRGELVGQGRSGHAFMCPVYAMIQRIRHLRLHQAPL
jgi:hypothetical protein